MHLPSDEDQTPVVPLAEMMDKSRRVWQKSQVVYHEPSRDGQPESRHIMEQLVQHYPQCEPELVNLLRDDNQLVVAHALLTLELLGSSTLCNLPSELLMRKGNITIVMGSFRNGMDLGGLARQVQKRAKERAARQLYSSRE